MTDDLYSSEEWKGYASRIVNEVVPMIKGSAATISLAPDGEDTDVKFAVELGFSIMLGKPIIVLVDKSRTLAPGLAKVADKVIEVDMDDPASMRDGQLRMVSWLKDQGHL